MTGVILFGAPATGKDTVTAALAALDPQYRLYQRIKCGPGRTAGYRMVEGHELVDLRRRGEVIWENSRYDATYVVDRTQLIADAATGVPVVHLGQLAAVDAVTTALPELDWVTVELWCPKTVAANRIRQRHTGDDEARLHAYDQTGRLTSADVRIDTSTTDPSEAARQIDQVRSTREPT